MGGAGWIVVITGTKVKEVILCLHLYAKETLDQKATVSSKLGHGGDSEQLEDSDNLHSYLASGVLLQQ